MDKLLSRRSLSLGNTCYRIYIVWNKPAEQLWKTSDKVHTSSIPCCFSEAYTASGGIS